MKEKLLLAAAALLGFATACDSTKRQTDMYGTPYSNYKIKGKVTDKAGQPIKDIEVDSYDVRPVTTGSDGSYELSGQNFGGDLEITFTDIDGPANGGDFAAKTVTVEFTEADRTAKGKGWDRGSFAKLGVDITLEEKE